jgi:hypothetical protein
LLGEQLEGRCPDDKVGDDVHDRDLGRKAEESIEVHGLPLSNTSNVKLMDSGDCQQFLQTVFVLRLCASLSEWSADE